MIKLSYIKRATLMDDVHPTSLPHAQVKLLLDLLQFPHVHTGSELLGGLLSWLVPPNLCLSAQLRNLQHRPAELFITASSLNIATFYEINHILFSWAPVEHTELQSM